MTVSYKRLLYLMIEKDVSYIVRVIFPLKQHYLV